MNETGDGLTRRNFVQLLGASAAFGGLACVERPPEKIFPYQQQPEEVIPGKPLHYASAMVRDGHAVGLLVTSYGGRPTKVEGNPDHPASLGAAGVFEQASVLDLYDPTRARELRQGRIRRSWDRFAREFGFGRTRADDGAGLRLLLAPTTSPLLGSLLGRVLARYPKARVTFHQPAGDHAFAGAVRAWGRPVAPIYEFSRAKVVVSLGADFTARGPFHLRYARQVAFRRQPGEGMIRLYQAEVAPTATGSLADHRVAARPSELAMLARALLDPSAPVNAGQEAWFHAAREELARNPGAGVVVVGDELAPELHAAGHAANVQFQNVGATVTLLESARVSLGDRELALEKLAEEMHAGAVDTLVVLDANPLYHAPAGLGLEAAWDKVATTVCLASHEHETGARATWFIPLAHWLEAWGDARALDGTVSFQQPLLLPLHSGRTACDVLGVLAGDTRDTYALLTAYWRERVPMDHDWFWERALQRGFLESSASRPFSGELTWDRRFPEAGPASEGAIELHTPPSPTVGDGAFAGNSWLLELPHPTTKLTWDNALLLSPTTAARLRLSSGETVELEREGRRLVAPVLVTPGHADDAGTLELGWGRGGHGVSAYRLGLGAGGTVAVRAAGGRHPLAVTQQHQIAPEDRSIVALRTLAAAREEVPWKGPQPTLLPDRNGPGHQWAMTIDTSVCNGCSACMVACQAENNVPVVGKERVLQGREMHWLRIDRWRMPDDEGGAVVNQPMLCQHCEKAPCEYVCPVNATVHSTDGLSEMVYNRCIGTRTCSNNCPYKVRRFNFFDYVDHGLVQLQKNPNVTVRERGVMEKCSFCVQRIRAAEIQARVDGRELRPGEFQTACQQACPTQAIRFGSLLHRETDMVRLRAEPRSYEALHELGTVPRVVYLARVVNRGAE